NRSRHVGTEKLRVLPADLGQRARRDVLGNAVVPPRQLPLEALGVLVPHAPGAGEYLIRPAAEQQRLGPALPLRDDLPALIELVHLLVIPNHPAAVLEAAIAVLVRAAARLNDAVEGDECLHHDPAHIRFSSLGGAAGLSAKRGILPRAGGVIHRSRDTKSSR